MSQPQPVHYVSVQVPLWQWEATLFQTLPAPAFVLKTCPHAPECAPGGFCGRARIRKSLENRMLEYLNVYFFAPGTTVAGRMESEAVRPRDLLKTSNPVEHRTRSHCLVEETQCSTPATNEHGPCELIALPRTRHGGTPPRTQLARPQPERLQPQALPVPPMCSSRKGHAVARLLLSTPSR